ncbi:MAG: CoA-binding protein, partial [Planctomycetota bacterium]
MAADAIEKRGLTLAKLSAKTVDKLAANLPPAANLHNPVDVLCDGLDDRYEFALNAVLDDDNVDMVLVLLTPQAMTQAGATAEAVVKTACRRNDKVVLACFLGAEKVEDGIRILREGRIPHYTS